MAYIVGLSDNINNYASTTLLSAVDVNVAVDGHIVLDGQLASVTGGSMYIYVKGNNEAVSSTVLAALNGGRWIEYFAYTGQPYLLVNDSNNSLNLIAGSVTLSDLAPEITPFAGCISAGIGSYAGGSTTATFTIPIMEDADILMVNKVTNANASYVINVTHSLTDVSILLDTDPGESTFAYTLFRIIS